MKATMSATRRQRCDIRRTKAAGASQLEIIIVVMSIALLLTWAIMPIKGSLAAMRGAQWQRLSKQFSAAVSILHEERQIAGPALPRSGPKSGDLMRYRFSAEGWPQALQTGSLGGCAGLWQTLSGSADPHWQVRDLPGGLCVVAEKDELGSERRFLIYDTHQGRVEIHDDAH